MANLYSFLIQIVVWCLLAPWHVIQILRGSLDLTGLRQRLGRWDFPPGNSGLRVVVHAVSLGEVLSVEALLMEIVKRWPTIEIILTTGTHEGLQVARRLQRRRGEIRAVGYLPWDRRSATRRWLSQCAPDVVMIVETELWPNLFLVGAELNIPVCIVNGRIYPEDEKFYRMLRFFFHKVLGCAAWIGVQDGSEKARFMRIGAPQRLIEVCGNLKLDCLPGSVDGDGEWKEYLSRPDLVLTAASTHAPEERLMLECFSSLRDSFGNLRLILAPRHVRRAKSVENLAGKYGFRAARSSRLSRSEARDWDVLILDEIGRLAPLYSRSNIVVIGGTFARRGGHNFLEAAARECAVVMGPNSTNFENLAHRFRDCQALIQVNQPQDLKNVLAHLLQDETARRELGRQARLLLDKMQGASAVCSQAIARILDIRDPAVEGPKPRESRKPRQEMAQHRRRSGLVRAPAEPRPEESGAPD